MEHGARGDELDVARLSRYPEAFPSSAQRVLALGEQLVEVLGELGEAAVAIEHDRVMVVRHHAGQHEVDAGHHRGVNHCQDPTPPASLRLLAGFKTMPNAHNGYYDTMREMGYVGYFLLVTFISATAVLDKVVGPDMIAVAPAPKEPKAVDVSEVCEALWIGVS